MAKEKQLEQTKSLDNFTTEKINVITNCLFGDYVEGEYVIPDEIKKELLEDKKVKKSVYKNSVFCNAYIVGYGDVVFEATFQQNTVKNIAKAELFVLENEYRVNGYIQNTIRTKIAEYVASIENFIENAYEYFNISVTDDQEVKKYDLKEDISLNAYINAKKNFNLNMDKLTAKDYNKLYKKYVTARLERLKRRKGGFSGQVLDRFNSEFAKIEKYFLRDGNYKAVSELLDKCIEDCVGVNPKFKKEEQEMFEELTPLVEEFSREAADVAESMHDKALKSLGKKDKEKYDTLEEQIRAGRYDTSATTAAPVNAGATTTYTRETSVSTSTSTGGGQNNKPKKEERVGTTDNRRQSAFDREREKVGGLVIGSSTEDISRYLAEGKPYFNKVNSKDTEEFAENKIQDLDALKKRLNGFTTTPVIKTGGGAEELVKYTKEEAYTPGTYNPPSTEDVKTFTEELASRGFGRDLRTLDSGASTTVVKKEFNAGGRTMGE